MFITRERVTCAGVCYGDTERAFEALLERLSSFFVVLLTCRFALCLFITESKSRVKHETNPQVLFSSFVFHVQINSRADYFGACLNTEMTKYRNVKIKSNLGHQKSCHYQKRFVGNTECHTWVAALICDGEAL